VRTARSSRSCRKLGTRVEFVPEPGRLDPDLDGIG
jgi:hypothetical protein